MELAQTAKTRLQEVFVKRFPEKAWKMLRLSSIFETELPKDLEKEIMEFLIKRYKDNVKKSQILVKAEFKKFLRLVKQTRTKKELRKIIDEKVGKDPTWCESVFLIKSKIDSIGGTTVDSERAFHLMSRIQSKLTNRLDKNLGTRLRITMHLPKDPTGRKPTRFSRHRGSATTSTSRK